MENYCKLAQLLRRITNLERRILQICSSSYGATDTWITCTDPGKSAPLPVAPVAKCKSVYLHHFKILTFKNSLNQIKKYKNKRNFVQVDMF